MTVATTSHAIPNDARRTARRLAFLKWLRKTHAWIGLWGAAIGLLFGISGFFLNHRAVLKIPAAQTQETSVQMPLPDPAPADAQAMAAWLQKELNLPQPAQRVRAEPSRPVAWGDRSLRQPERWQINFMTPASGVQAEYWVGSKMVSVKRSEGNFVAVITNMHKGVGLGIGWVLLIDTFAGSIVLLSLTGVLLWTQLNRRRVVGATIAVTSTVIGIALVMQAL